jgi:hypothetical protein
MATANHINDPSPTENWRDVPGWGGYYQVSDHGRVRSVDRIVESKRGHRRYRGKIIQPAVKETGHLTVSLYRDCSGSRKGIHTLVAAAFLGPCPDGMEVCHRNSIPSDNRPVNLRYGTRQSNVQDMIAHGTHMHLRKTHCPRGHELVPQNLMRAAWERDGKRQCLACNRASAHISYHRDQRPDRAKIADSYYEAIMRDAA